MSENIIIQPLFHQRSHSMPVGHAFLNNNPMLHNLENSTDTHQNYSFKRSSALRNDSTEATQLTTNDGFPLPMSKSIASRFCTTLPDNVNSDDPVFFCSPKTLLNVFDFNKKDSISCPLIINCKMDRGFFISQAHWTCYRRNYFQVSASFIIPGHSDQSCYALQLNTERPMQPIRQFLLRLKACTSTSSLLMNGSQNESGDSTTLKNHNMIRPIALTQMTPKRDKGPQREPPSVPINPSDNMFSSEQSCVTFERLQFRVATANNGKRRASQQFFRLIFELIAELDDETQHVVSECYSSPLVVRGRSPGHYNTDPPHEFRKRKRKDVSVPYPIKQEYSSSSSSPHSNNEFMLNSPPLEQQLPQLIATLPPPQYVYAPPSMVIDTRQTSESATTNNSPVSYTATQSHKQSMLPPAINASLNQFHGRSQSANDSEFFSRERNTVKFPSKLEHQHPISQNNGLFNNYNMGMERALRNWQQQVARQRADSAATFNSYDNNTDRASTRPNTPISYNNNISPISYPHESNTQWSNRPQYLPNVDKSNQHNDFQQENPSKLYQ